jgi:photosystem II stability/assembly factor-like uncharacterized protein
MKSLLVLVSVLFLSSYSRGQVTQLDRSSSQELPWRKIETGEAEIVHTISRFGDSILRARTETKLLRSKNLGETWQVVNDPFDGDSPLASYQFFNDSLGYVACALSPWLYKTTNGGESWDSKTHTLMSIGLHGFIMFDTVRGLAWSAGQTAQTQDGGKWWFVRSNGGAVNDIDFSDELHGFAVGDARPWGEIDPPVSNAAHFARSSDGGRNWENVYPTWPNNWRRIHAMSSKRLLVLAAKHVFESKNGGDTWKVILEARPGEVFQNLTRDRNGNLFICGLPGLLMKSSDTAVSWTKLPVPVTGIISYATFLDSLTGFFSGTDGLFKTTTGGNSWVYRQTDSRILSASVYPNPAADFAELRIELAEPARCAITLVDLLGAKRLSIVSDVLLTQGLNTMPLDVSKLPSGSYFLRVEGEGLEKGIAVSIIR